MATDSKLDDRSGGIQVISRAAAVLRSLKDQTGGLSLGQISERVGLPRSTVQRIVGALQAEHFVIAASPDRGIRLGPGLTWLAKSARIDVVEILHPYLVELGDKTGETIDLAVLRAGKMVFVDQIPSRHRLRAVSSIGEAFPLTSTANGKACLALMSDADILHFLETEQPERAKKKANRDQFLGEIAAVRKQQVAFDQGEHTEGISAIGAALADTDGNLYAISIPAPTSRFERNAAKIDRALQLFMQKLRGLEIFATA